MYVVTFYSFKGGVGRTMALANIGAELARTGRRVLLVDFDLEAPGLHTFDLLRPAKPTKGIVDFVADFSMSGSSPDVNEYLYQPDLKQDISGSLSIMSTGMPDEHYGERLASIDWQHLYTENDGYLLFEDLKQQWKRAVSPDYVLIDSRTGHTDVGGICTRQLPDAAAILFFPNEQNRRGVEIVVDDIRSDPSRAGQPVELYFVAANVPDLDDEDRILQDCLEHFKRTLRYEKLDATVHHYNSLALLQQTIFTLERPRTKLAKEYRRLAENIISANLEDRRVVLGQLDRFPTRGGLGRRTSPTEIETTIRQIRVLYSADGEILSSLARINRQMGRDEVADSLIAEARQAGYETVETLIDRARDLYRTGHLQGARESITAALHRPHRTQFPQSLPFQIVLQFDPAFLEHLASQLDPQLSGPDRLYIAERLLSSIEGAKAAELLLRPLAERGGNQPYAIAVRFQLGLCLMPQGRFREALSLFTLDGEQSRNGAIPECFNSAMAQWGVTGKIPQDLFGRVVELHADAKRPRLDENYCQCIALALWAVGRNEEARSYTARAEEILGAMKTVFSAWRYLEVSSDDFRQDLKDLRKLIETGDGLPAVLTCGAHARIQ